MTDVPISLLQQMARGHFTSGVIVDVDDVGICLLPATGDHYRHAQAGGVFFQPTVIAPDLRHRPDDAVHPPFHQAIQNRIDRSRAKAGKLFEQQPVSFLFGGIGNAVEHTRGADIFQPGRDHPQRVAPAADHAPRQRAGPVAQSLDYLTHVLPGTVCNVRSVVNHARNCLGRNAGRRRHILNRYPSGRTGHT